MTVLMAVRQFEFFFFFFFCICVTCVQAWMFVGGGGGGGGGEEKGYIARVVIIHTLQGSSGLAHKEYIKPALKCCHCPGLVLRESICHLWVLLMISCTNRLCGCQNC